MTTTEDYAIRRREYVDEIRKSFDLPEDGGGRGNFGKSGTDGEEGDSPAGWIFFKIRAAAALLLFAGFLFWSCGGTELFGYRAADVRELVGEPLLEDLISNWQDADGENADGV